MSPSVSTSVLRLARCFAFSLAATMAIAPLSAAPDGTPYQQLAGHKNAKRVLLVFAPGESDARFRDQQKRWVGEQAAFADYALVVLPAFTTQKSAAPLAERYGIKPGAFAVLLIGKDGNEAYRSEKPVDAKEFYRRIDQMPMRRAEVRERSR